MALPRPGFIGLLIRTVLGVVVILFLGVWTIRDTSSFWDGYSDPVAAILPVLLLTIFSRGVVNELLQVSWGWWPSIALLAGLGITVVVGAMQATPFGPVFGTYLWAWTLLFAFLLGPAFLLAVTLRTPGCEMRSFAHLVAIIRGGEVESVACPGWVDRFDHVRIGGKW